MTNAVELPGDANQLTRDGAIRVLQLATASDYIQRQAAGQQLTSWEAHSGYYSTLQSIYLDKSLSLDTRFLAIIQLKNGIDKHWRLYAHIKSGISPEEKALIRSRLFEGTVDEDERNLALHNALTAAKVIRIEYPTEWPDALPSIIGLLRSHGTTRSRRLQGLLQLLLRIVKELATARLRKSQTALQSITPEIVYVLAEIYSSRSVSWIDWLTSGSGNADEAERDMLDSLLTLKVMRRLIIWGFERPHGDDTVRSFWSLSQSQFGQLLNFISHDPKISAPYRDIVGKHLFQFSKFHNEMASSHHASFVFLPNSLSLVHAYWDLAFKFADVFDKSEGIRQGSSESASKTDGPLLEKLALKGLILLRACMTIGYSPLQTFKYRTAEVKQEQQQAKDIIKTELFKDDLVLSLASTIISRLFIFRKADLEAWEEDPEEWEQQEQSEGSAYLWEVRPCAEKLFLDLLTQYRYLLVPPLLEYFKSAQDVGTDIATKEAIYTAMGLSAAHVHDVFDFESVLCSTVVRDVQQTAGLHKVLRRRIAILISQWAPVKLGDKSRPVVYQIFRHLLNPNDETNDLVVRITAARELRWVADELDFNVEAFLPFTADVFTELNKLIQTVEVDETKLAILETIRILVTRMENQVAQFGDQLMTSLPRVWESSRTDEYMIKQAVIAIFSALVMSMGSNSQRFQPFMIPLLSEAARAGSDLHVHLIDESLELWNAMLMQSCPPLSPEIISLAEFALPLVEYRSETATQALTAIESYLLLAPGAMLEDKLRRGTLNALSYALDSKSREQSRLGTLCIEYLIRSAVEMGGAEGVSTILQDMVDTGLLHKVMGALHDAWEAHQTTGPNRKISKLSTVTEGDYLAILGRLALAEPSLFAQMLNTLGDISQTWGWLSGEWFGYLSEMDDLERRKLYLLGLSRLLELPPPMQDLVLGKLQDYFETWTNVIAELQDGMADATDTLIWQEVEASEYDTPKSVAEREASRKDPIHSVHAFGFVRLRLQDVIGRAGGEAEFQEKWAANVDKEVLEKFQQLAQVAQQP